MRDLEPLSGGFWSAAYAYAVGDDELVARFGQEREWFEADRAAMAHASADLPVPDVLDVGEAPFGGVYVISRRHHGRFLEDVGVDEVDRAGPTLQRLLAALRAVPPADGPSWRQWLVDGLVDDPTHPTAGWRATLAADRDGDRVFRAAEARVREMVDACPERRDLVHGDLLHRNVLVSEDASRVTAVFSWKCSTRGDHLFDTAWCTFWGDTFHPGIAAAIGEVSAADAERHHCYELQIGASHLGWSAWTEDTESSRIIRSRVEVLLERGPAPRSS